MQSFKLKLLGVTILQGVEFPIFLLIFEWALQQCSATALPVIISAGRVKNSINLFSCMLENYALIAIQSCLVNYHPCNVQFTMFYFIVQYTHYWCTLCVQDFTFLDMNLTTWKMLILYFENSSFDVIMKLVGSDHYIGIRSQKTDPWTFMKYLQTLSYPIHYSGGKS